MIIQKNIKHCYICKSNNIAKLLEYHKPPQGEVTYSFSNTPEYNRGYYLCNECGHYTSSISLDLEKLYSGEYATSNYKDINGIHSNFLRIINLPYERSDNQARVEYITQALKNYINLNFSQIDCLDIGSGLGVFPYKLKEAGVNSFALDPDAQAAKHIAERLEIETYQGDFFKVVISKKFHLITLNKVLEHVEDPRLMIEKATSLLNDGGLLYIELPDGENAIKDILNQDREEFSVDHLHVFSIESTKRLIQEHKLKLIEVFSIREPSTKYTIRSLWIKAS